MCIMFLVKILKMTLIIPLMITVDFRSSVTLDSVEREGWWLPGHSKVSTMEQLKLYSHCMYRLFGSVEQCRECKYMKWERCPGGCLEKVSPQHPLHMLHTHWSRILQPWDGQSIDNSILIMYAVARKVNSGPFREKSILHCGKTC